MPLNNRRIVNVSNRLPVKVDAGGQDISKSSGGLVSALEGVGDDVDLAWIGWPGGAVEDADRQRDLAKRLKDEFNYTPVYLTDDEVDDHYHGLSNSSLWPLLHYNPTYFNYQTRWFDTYRKVNQRFADAVLEIATPDDLIWVHDYQLMLVPAMLRQARPELRIGFFLHTPFPSYELFRIHPNRDELIEGLLGADLIGFHTFGYLRHFRSTTLRLTGRESDIYTIHHEDFQTSIGVYPIGINGPGFKQTLESDAYHQRLDELKQDYAGCRMVLSVERLDYTKGIPQKLKAIDKYLTDHPESRENTIFVLIAVPSREDVGEYKMLKQEIELLVSQINGRHSTMSNVPVNFINRSVNFTALCAMYSLAEVMMVTPLIDGMNLVAKEYLACQDPQKQGGPGVLILSEFAGAAQELSDALMVNPHDIDGMADALAHALDMPESERRDRMIPMRKRATTFDAVKWAKQYIGDLARITSEDHHDVVRPLKPETLAPFHVKAPGRKALFLDYDGTLRSFVKDAALATPQEPLLETLAKLDQRDDLDITVVSGRNEVFLNEHLGHFNFNLVAEHGFRGRPRGKQWTDLAPDADLSWMDTVADVFNLYAELTPGTHVEIKRSAIVWHYRAADPEFGKWKADELIGHLKEAITNFPVKISHGHKIVEVTSQQVNKGVAMESLMHADDYAAVFCIGDDATDEAMFARHREDHVVSVKVGPGVTQAKYRVKDVKAVWKLLQRIADNDVPAPEAKSKVTA